MLRATVSVGAEAEGRLRGPDHEWRLARFVKFQRVAPLPEAVATPSAVLG
jgi:hypothetical protein